MKERREKGYGSISQRKDGTWTARLDLGKNKDGKRKIKAFYGKTKSDVKQQLKNFQEEVNKFNNPEEYKLTFSELLIYWLENIKRHQLKTSS